MNRGIIIVLGGIIVLLANTLRLPLAYRLPSSCESFCSESICMFVTV